MRYFGSNALGKQVCKRTSLAFANHLGMAAKLSFSHICFKLLMSDAVLEVCWLPQRSTSSVVFLSESVDFSFSD